MCPRLRAKTCLFMMALMAFSLACKNYGGGKWRFINNGTVHSRLGISLEKVISRYGETDELRSFIWNKYNRKGAAATPVPYDVYKQINGRVRLAYVDQDKDCCIIYDFNDGVAEGIILAHADYAPEGARKKSIRWGDIQLKRGFKLDISTKELVKRFGEPHVIDSFENGALQYTYKTFASECAEVRGRYVATYIFHNDKLVFVHLRDEKK